MIKWSPHFAIGKMDLKIFTLLTRTNDNDKKQKKKKDMNLLVRGHLLLYIRVVVPFVTSQWGIPKVWEVRGFVRTNFVGEFALRERREKHLRVEGPLGQSSKSKVKVDQIGLQAGLTLRLVGIYERRRDRLTRLYLNVWQTS